MKNCIRILAYCQLFIAATAFSQSKPVKATIPAWVTQNVIDYNIHTLDKSAQDGVIDLDYEDQTNLTTQESFTKRSKRILSNAGVQNESQVSIVYDPSYQKLFIHAINIIRNSKTIDKLELSKIKVLHQEEELDDYLYNGSLKALLILEDVRPGDIIEYSFTIKGFNPIFKNKYSASFDLNYSVPVYNLYFKLLSPPARKMYIKNFNHKLDAVTRNENNQVVYEWSKKEVKPLLMQDYVPRWYDPYESVQVSEYASWKEVNDWAMELFPTGKKLSPAVMDKVDAIKTEYSTDEKRAGAVIRFVQDDIRYMGIEMGVNSHKPADPSKVFAQRFGDCKEKTYLACCMLQAMNIEANPVLINTVRKKELLKLLPAPRFDHATLRLKVNNVVYMIDPTIAYQRGPLQSIAYPDYQVGLIIADSTNALTTIPFRNVTELKVKENFRITSMNGSGTFVVKTFYTGEEADKVRELFNTSSNSELMTSYQKFYAAHYEDIRADSLNYIDNDSTGQFFTDEYYTIPTFWSVDKRNAKSFFFMPFSVNESLKRVKEKDRAMPISLSYPVNIYEDITIEVPEPWKVTESDVNVNNNSYRYNYKFYSNDNVVHLNAHYETLKDYASVDEAPAYFNDLDMSQYFAAFEITSDGKSKAIDTGKEDNNYFGAITLVIIGAVSGAIYFVKKRR